MKLSDRDMITDGLFMQKQLLPFYTLAEQETANLHLRKVFHEYHLEEEELHTSIFNIMHRRGWYKTPVAGQQAIETAIISWEEKIGQAELRTRG